MFKLIITMFAMINGVPADHPFSAGYISSKFQTREACMKYLTTEEGRGAKKELEDEANKKDGDVTIKVACVKIEDKPSDDGTI